MRKEESPAPRGEDAQEGQADFFEQVEDTRPEGHPERELLRSEIRSRIDMALKRLSPRERLVFEMKHYQGLKLRTIGDALETTEQTVKNCLFRATQKLRESLQTAL